MSSNGHEARRHEAVGGGEGSRGAAPSASGESTALISRLRARFRPDIIRWRAHHALTHRTSIRIPFWRGVLPTGGRSHRRVLILSHDSAICQSQIYPFYFYRRQLGLRYGAEIREYDVNAFLHRSGGRLDEADVVVVQPWFTLGDEGLARLLEAVRRRCRPQRIVFLDSYAPTDLRFAKTLAGQVNVYVKKHVLADRAQYGRPTRGDTGLMDFYGRRYGLDFPQVTFEVPPALLDALVIGPSFATADYMLAAFKNDLPPRGPRNLDVHARMARDGTDWYRSLRSESLDALRAIRGITTASGTGVARSEFLRELARARLCFSPFGYGEVAWRDYEAVMCGSLLLKPDMSHVQTDPDIFVAEETYVPVRWDLADLETKVRYYLAHEDERLRIAGNAHRVLRDYFRRERFVDQMAPLFR
ncbi:MAG: glycosyltransferase [Pseudomonadota bacterium]